MTPPADRTARPPADERPMPESGPAVGMDDADAVALEFGEDGLVPAVAQDAGTGEVLMLAFADREAVAATLDTGQAHYRSRSRDELWEKGATSGHVQTVAEVRVDCDADAVLYRVEQTGGACHTGQRSCFHRAVTGVAGREVGDLADGDGAAGDGAGEDGPGADDRNEAGDGRREEDDDGELVLAVENVGEEVFDPDAVYD